MLGSLVLSTGKEPFLQEGEPEAVFPEAALKAGNAQQKQTRQRVAWTKPALCCGHIVMTQ